MAGLILPEADLLISTRRNTQIENHMSRAEPTDGDYLSQQKEQERRPNARRRFVGPCNTYDCHGLTFAARRTNVVHEIEVLLFEDDFVEVKKEDVLSGDIVIYWSDPNPLLNISSYITHSGIVLKRLPLNDLLILSKWGHGDEWVHSLADCPYSAANVKFHRIVDDPRANVIRPVKR